METKIVKMQKKAKIAKKSKMQKCKNSKDGYEC